jgi:plastocyanin
MRRRPGLLPWLGILVVCHGTTMGWTVWADDRSAPAPTPTTASVPVEGIVTYDGPLPEALPVAEAATVRQLVEVDPRSKGLKDAAVWLEGVPAMTAASPRKPPVRVDQQNFFFVPHVLAVDTGQEVVFLNSDNANHGVIATSLEPANCFNVSIPLASQTYTHRFIASNHPVAIGCPVHVSMAAWIYVFEHPFHDVTDERGRFRLPPAPPGEYTLQIRHADGGMRRQQAIDLRSGRRMPVRVELHAADLKAQAGSSSKKKTDRP